MQLRRVVGDSMLPTLQPGQIVLVGSARSLKIGDIVMVYHDGLEKIKRVQQIASGKISVVGDNSAASTDSRDFGWLDRSAIRAKLIWPRR